jgi:hypothetical protein
LNYFSHYFFDHIPHNHYYNTGLVLPDFARAAEGSKRINIHLEFDPDNQPGFYNLNQGSKRHYSRDATFHNSEFFTQNSKLLEELFIQYNFPKEGQRIWFVEHILLELLLDRALIRKHRDVLEDFYDSLRQTKLQTIIDFLAHSGKDGSTGFSRFWNGFLDAEYLQYYLVDEKFIYSLNRIFQRAKQPELTDVQAGIILRIVGELEGRIYEAAVKGL